MGISARPLADFGIGIAPCAMAGPAATAPARATTPIKSRRA